MSSSDSRADTASVVAETVEFVQVSGTDGRYVGRTPDWFGDVMFGGFVLAQATHALTRTAPAGTRLHSLHAYFVSAARLGSDLEHTVTVLRDGRSFSSRRLETLQDGRLVFTMTGSFTTDGEGYEYERPLRPDRPGPDSAPSVIDDGPWETVNLGPDPPDGEGLHGSTHRLWIRVATSLPDNPHLHTAMTAFISDITHNSTRPRHLDGDTRGIISLDHALWFHRQPRADHWLHYDAHSAINTAGRGLLRGQLYDQDRRLVTSVAQETLLRPYDQA